MNADAVPTANAADAAPTAGMTPKRPLPLNLIPPTPAHLHKGEPE